MDEIITMNVHEREEDPLNVKIEVVSGEGTMTPYVRMHVGPACFFVRDPMTLMKLTTQASAAFNDLSAALREA